jgi:hypothetical protein
LLELLLSGDFPAADALRLQAGRVHAAGSSCTCGCPSIYLEVDRGVPRAPTIDRVPVQAVCDEWVGVALTVYLHVLHGYLHEIEAVPADDVPRPDWGWPPLDRLRLQPGPFQPNVNE